MNEIDARSYLHRMTRQGSGCAPKAIASALDEDPIEVTRLLAEYSDRIHDPKLTGIERSATHRLMADLGCEVFTGEAAKRPDGKERWDKMWDRYYARREDWWNGRGDVFTEPREPSYAKAFRYTITQWLKAHPTTNALLHVDGHVLHVRDGKVVTDTAPSSRSRVQAWVVVPA